VIYPDHNATTPLEPRVLEAMLPYLTDRFGNASSYYQLGRDARDAVEEARERIAACIGARAEEILFTASGTEADNLALRGVARSLREKGKHLVTSCIEHHAVLETCKTLAQEGYEVTFLSVDGEGQVDPDEPSHVLQAMGLEPRTAQGSIRFSLGHHNTAEEIDQTLGAMAEIVPRLTTISSFS
jgi:cysteine desulfurase